MAYLDCAAHSPIDPRVYELLAQASKRMWGNPHNLSHTSGRDAAQAIDLARHQVAQLFGAPAHSVTFTSGATEANNLAVLGMAGKLGADFHAVTTLVEHPSVLVPFQQLQGHARIEFLHVDSNGALDEQEIHTRLTPDVDLVSVLWVNNETGVIQSLDRIADITRSNGIRLHVDATQAVGRVYTGQLWECADMISISAHKFGGPMGVGALIGGRDQLGPLMFGGTQQGGLRPGTLPTPLIAGLGLACAIRQEQFAEERSLLEQHTATLRAAFRDEGRVITPHDAAPGILSVAFEPLEAETLLAVLDDVALATGAACSSQNTATSHVLRAMGVSDAEANAAVRISINAQTPAAEIDDGVSRIKEALQTLRACASDFVVPLST